MSNDNELYDLGLSLDIFTDPNNKDLSVVIPAEPPAPVKKKKPKSSKPKTKDDDESSELSLLQSNESYIDSYQENNNALKGVVVEIDQTQNLINEELVKIKKSKTMSKKYDYLSSLVTTKSQLFGSKISAIKEIGNNITQSHNLELKRQKELHISEEDNASQVLDLYKSYINTPKDTVPSFASDRTMFATPDVFSAVDTMQRTPESITPQQHMMLLEQDPNVRTVVMYNKNTGQKWFDVINVITKEKINNVDIPDPMLLENLNIDIINGIARDTKLDITYPLIVV